MLSLMRMNPTNTLARPARIKETDEEIRVFSMRKAERHEEKIYYNNL